MIVLPPPGIPSIISESAYRDKDTVVRDERVCSSQCLNSQSEAMLKGNWDRWDDIQGRRASSRHCLAKVQIWGRTGTTALSLPHGLLLPCRDVFGIRRVRAITTPFQEMLSCFEHTYQCSTNRGCWRWFRPVCL